MTERRPLDVSSGERNSIFAADAGKQLLATADVRSTETVFCEAEFSARIRRLTQAIRRKGADVLVLTGPENIFWATGRQTAGYFAFQAVVVPLDGEPILLVRELERTGAAAGTWLRDIRTYGDADDPATALSHILAGPGFRTVAVERQGWFVSPALADRIVAALGDVRVVDGSGVVEELRMVKSPTELDAIRQAASYAEAALAAGIDACGTGVSENTVAARMLSVAVDRGSEPMAMEPLVSSGPRAGIPHASWRRRTMGPGDCVFLELAASHNRYHAALMRSVWIGQVATPARRMMDCALRALEAALAAISPGRSCGSVHAAGQAVIDAEGYSAALRKRIGYSMGVAFAPDWGEGTVLSLNSGVLRALEPGMVFHLPVALRAYGAFTVGASETVIVTETGAEPLSSLNRDIVVRP